MRSLVSTIATIWRLSLPYFRSDDRKAGCLLLLAVVGMELALVALQVILNLWYNRFYNTLQDRDWNAFVSAILFFCVIAAANTVIAVYQVYLGQWLQIRWRRWMTENYLGQWLDAANHYRMQLLGDAADNPDQRIAEDLRMFVESTLSIGSRLLNALGTLSAFIVILWTLSQEAPLQLFGTGLTIPGYLVWAALIYAIVGSLLTHLIGWPLIPLNFQRQRVEADFRFNLVRTRENAEQIASLGGETAERERHLGRFGHVFRNWIAIMRRQKQLTFFTQGYTQVALIFPYLVVSPAYFSGAMQLGGLMQTASAFNSVQNALSYFINIYIELAEYRAVIARLTGFEDAIAAGRAAAVTPPAIEVVPRGGSPVFTADRLNVRLPDGEPIIAADHVAFPPGERVLVDRAIRRREIDTVSRHRRDLAIWIGPRNRAGRSQHYAAAAAAVFSSDNAFGGRVLSGGGRHVQRRTDCRSPGRRRASGTGRAARRRSPLEPHPVARRAAAACDRAGAVGGTRLSLPRRGDGGARRSRRGGVVPVAARAAQRHDRGFDRSPLNAQRFSPPPCRGSAR